jgi:hypothetical protein
LQENVLRKIINDVVLPFYKPKMFSRTNDDIDVSRERSVGKIHNVVSREGPMFEKKKGSVDASISKLSGETGGKEKKINAKVLDMTEASLIVDLGNDKLMDRVKAVYEVRDKIKKRIIDKSPNVDRSQASKNSTKKKKVAQFDVRTNATSQNDSQLIPDDERSISKVEVSRGENQFFNSMTGFDSNKTLFSKVKAREGFIPQIDHIPTISMLKAQDYDTKEDINLIVMAIKDTLEIVKKKWKSLDQQKLTGLIRKTLIIELWKLEERKHVRREQKEILRKIQEAKQKKLE